MVGLDFAELKRLSHELLAGCGTVFRLSDRGDNGIQHVNRPQQTLQDVGAFAGFAKTILGSLPQHAYLMRGIGGQHLAQGHGAGDAAIQSDHVGREGGLQPGVLEQIVEHHIGMRSAFEVEYEACIPFGGFVSHIADACQLFALFVFNGLLHLLAHRFNAHLIRHLRDDDADGVAVFFNVGAGAHFDGASPGAIGLAGASGSQDEAACGEIRARDIGKEGIVCGFGLSQQVDGGIYDLGEIVRRDVSSHAYRYALAAVGQQVGEPRRQHQGFAMAAVKVGGEIHRFFVYAAEHMHG